MVDDNDDNNDDAADPMRGAPRGGSVQYQRANRLLFERCSLSEISTSQSGDNNNKENVDEDV